MAGTYPTNPARQPGGYKPTSPRPSPSSGNGPSPDTQDLINRQGGGGGGNKYIAVYNPQTGTYWDGVMGPDGKIVGELVDTGSKTIPPGATLQGQGAPTAAATGSQIPLNLGAGGGGGGMTAYEQAQITLDKQKLADAEAQQKADQLYRESQAVEAFDKQWQDYQTKNYYGSFYGPASAAPAGSPWAYKLPEPADIQAYYKNNPQAGPDPFSQPISYSGYSGSGFLNAQQPGIQNAGAVPMGAITTPIPGQQPANPFPGATSGNIQYDPNAAQTGQNVGAPIKSGGNLAAPSGGNGTTSGVDPNLIQAISAHPAANQFVLSMPGASQFVAKALGQQSVVPAPIPGGTNG